MRAAIFFRPSPSRIGISVTLNTVRAFSSFNIISGLMNVGWTCSPNMNFCSGSNSPHICSSSWGFALLPLHIISTTMVWCFFPPLYAITSAHLSWVFTVLLSSILDWWGGGLVCHPLYCEGPWLFISVWRRGVFTTIHFPWKEECQ